jgi:hypothetical protein
MIIPVFSDITSFKLVESSQNFGKVSASLWYSPTMNPEEVSRCDIQEVQHRGLE